jgi:hypothetical protein
MEYSQVTAVLTSVGLERDEWLSFDNVFKYISLEADKVLFTTPTAAQFYFPTDQDFFLVRDTAGSPRLVPNNYVLKTGEVALNHNEKLYVVNLLSGGKNYSDEVGIYHDIVSVQSIAAFMKK